MTMDHSHHNQPHSKGELPTGTSYTCPMHPEIMQERPGMYPECGMNLAAVLMSVSTVVVALNALLLRRQVL